MTTEQEMLEALDGNFWSFAYKNNGVMVIERKEVTKNYIHRYDFGGQDQNTVSRYGRYSRTNRLVWAQNRRMTFWTEEKIKALIQHYHAGYSARRIGRIVGIGRWEVGLKLNELGLLSRYGVPYQS